MPEGSIITFEHPDLEGSGVPNGRLPEPRASRPRDVTAIASFRGGLAARLGRWSGRPTLFAVAALLLVAPTAWLVGGLAACLRLAPPGKIRAPVGPP